MQGIEHRTYLAFVVIITIAFGWVVSPYLGPILWAVVAAIVFEPLNRRLSNFMPRWPNLSAFVTLLIIILLIIIPAILIGMSLLDELIGLYGRIQSKELDVAKMIADVQNSLPRGVSRTLQRIGLSDIEQASRRFSDGIANVIRTVATGAVNIGQSALGFVVGIGIMLYVSFFLLRDGQDLADQILRKLPLVDDHKTALAEKFTTVIRATIKGSIVVAIMQGLIGGLIFWALGVHAPLLGGVLMGFFSLLPAIGTGLVWVPVALYLLITGSIWQGLVLVFCGFFVIGMVDNLLRPILVGKDTRMPDYIVLISTLGGISILGFNGFILGPVVAALFMAAWENFGAFRNRE
ncbi:AI-2E family transporter [Aquisediminimonas profunda]|uniref:AI-2E family transporter n=1 Tax=Aquisediminimonas profunda TaxID=1550733 RepID=UPI001C6320CE|nr:AI-2E family transporter [Aquisediminimonas profunda]